MATNFYLADERFMTMEEIEDFDSAMFCRRISVGKRGLIYSLFVHPIYLYNIPKDIKLYNDNNVDIENVGELIKEINSKNAVLQPPYSIEKREEEINKVLVRKKLSDIVSPVILEKTEQYLKRIYPL